MGCGAFSLFAMKVCSGAAMSVELKVTNLPAFNAQVTSWFDSVAKATEEAAVGLAKEVFETVLEESPQFSGDFTANWKVSVDAPAPVSSFIPGAVTKVEVGAYGMASITAFKRGDPEAIEFAKTHAAWQTIKLGQRIFISNSAHHDEDYAWKIEDGSIKFRPVNAGAGAVAKRSVAMVIAKYKTIGASELASLRRRAR